MQLLLQIMTGSFCSFIGISAGKKGFDCLLIVRDGDKLYLEGEDCVIHNHIPMWSIIKSTDMHQLRLHNYFTYQRTFHTFLGTSKWVHTYQTDAFSEAASRVSRPKEVDEPDIVNNEVDLMSLTVDEKRFMLSKIVNKRSMGLKYLHCLCSKYFTSWKNK